MWHALPTIRVEGRIHGTPGVWYPRRSLRKNQNARTEIGSGAFILRRRRESSTVRPPPPGSAVLFRRSGSACTPSHWTRSSRIRWPSRSARRRAGPSGIATAVRGQRVVELGMRAQIIHALEVVEKDPVDVRASRIPPSRVSRQKEQTRKARPAARWLPNRKGKGNRESTVAFGGQE